MPWLRPTDPPKSYLLKPPVVAGSMALIGFVPFARGTVATLACAAAALAAWHMWSPPIWAWWPVALAAALASWFAGWRVLKLLPQIKDPGWFVLDEAAGFFVALGVIGADSPLDILAGLLTFRFYDIAKPWPVRNFERIPGSLGILADDLVAGVFAAATWLVGVSVYVELS